MNATAWRKLINTHPWSSEANLHRVEQATLRMLSQFYDEMADPDPWRALMWAFDEAKANHLPEDQRRAEAALYWARGALSMLEAAQRS